MQQNCSGLTLQQRQLLAELDPMLKIEYKEAILFWDTFTELSKLFY